MYLTQNAEKIMDTLRSHATAHNTCAACPDTKEDGTMLSAQVTQTCNKQTCQIAPTAHCGLGTGRNYYTIENPDAPTGVAQLDCQSFAAWEKQA